MTHTLASLIALNTLAVLRGDHDGEIVSSVVSPRVSVSSFAVNSAKQDLVSELTPFVEAAIDADADAAPPTVRSPRTFESDDDLVPTVRTFRGGVSR